MTNYTCLLVMDSRGKYIQERLHAYIYRARFPIDITLVVAPGATIADLVKKALHKLSKYQYDLVIFMGV